MKASHGEQEVEKNTSLCFVLLLCYMQVLFMLRDYECDVKNDFQFILANLNCGSTCQYDIHNVHIFPASEGFLSL